MQGFNYSGPGVGNY